LEAVKRLPALARRKVKVKPLLAREIDGKLVPAAWKRAVYSNPELPEGAVDRDAYVVCVLERLFRALNRRDVFASPPAGGRTRGRGCWTASGGRLRPRTSCTG
jgi:hypothetical protein